MPQLRRQQRNGRQLVFLGDVIDRGQQSVLMLHYVEQAVRLGGHYFIPGNHEEKLARTWEFWIKTGEAVGRSRSNTETFLSLMKQPMDVQERLIRFIQHQPAYRRNRNGTSQSRRKYPGKRGIHPSTQNTKHIESPASLCSLSKLGR